MNHIGVDKKKAVAVFFSPIKERASLTQIVRRLSDLSSGRWNFQGASNKNKKPSLKKKYGNNHKGEGGGISSAMINLW